MKLIADRKRALTLDHRERAFDRPDRAYAMRRRALEHRHAAVEHSHAAVELRHTSDERRESTVDIRRRARGFTIIEVLLAMAILLFGMTAVLGLLMFGAGLSRTALLRTTAASAIEAVAADLDETLFPMVEGEAGPPVDIKDRALPGEAGIVYSATAHENPQNALEYRVDIEMSWSSAGVQREKRFSMILLREISYGERLRKRFVEGVKDESKKVSLPEDSAKK